MASAKNIPVSVMSMASGDKAEGSEVDSGLSA
jgi:hypothetical protein